MHYSSEDQFDVINDEKENLIIKFADYDTFKTYVLSKYDQVVNDVSYEKTNIHYYAIKRIKFINREVPILLQNKNGSCPLLCITNILLLRNQLNINREITKISQKTIEKKIMNVILESNKNNVVNSNTSCNFRKNIIECVEVLPQLKYGLDLNCKFTDVQAFEYTKGLCIFDMLNIPLYHGWVVTADNSFYYPYLKDYSYNVIINKIIRFNEYFEKKKENWQDVRYRNALVNYELVEAGEEDKKKWKKMDMNLRKFRLIPLVKGNESDKEKNDGVSANQNGESKGVTAKKQGGEGSDEVGEEEADEDNEDEEEKEEEEEEEEEEEDEEEEEADEDKEEDNGEEKEEGREIKEEFENKKEDKKTEGAEKGQGKGKRKEKHKEKDKGNENGKNKQKERKQKKQKKHAKMDINGIKSINRGTRNFPIFPDDVDTKSEEETWNVNYFAEDMTREKPFGEKRMDGMEGTEYLAEMERLRNEGKLVNTNNQKNEKHNDFVKAYEQRQIKSAEAFFPQRMNSEEEHTAYTGTVNINKSVPLNSTNHLQYKEKHGSVKDKKIYRSASNKYSDIYNTTNNNGGTVVPIFPDERVSSDDAIDINKKFLQNRSESNFVDGLQSEKKRLNKKRNGSPGKYIERTSVFNVGGEDSNKTDHVLTNDNTNIDYNGNNENDRNNDDTNNGAPIPMDINPNNFDSVLCVDNNTDISEQCIMVKNYEDEIKLTPYEIHEGFVMSEFLEFYKTQLTVEGLKSLQKSVNANQLVAFFRNNHFNTLFKYKEKLFLLATDHSFLHLNCSWELFDNVENDTSYYDNNFEPLSAQRNIYRNGNYSVTYSNHYEINNNKNVYCVERQNSSSSLNKKRKKKKKKCNFM